MLNRTEIIGRIGADAEVKDFPTSQLISFSVAVSESYTNKQGEKVTNTTWVECSRWTNNVSIAQYIKKGDLIYVEGKMNNRAYLGSDGEAKVVNGINVLHIELLGSKSDSPQSAPPKQERPQANQSNSFVDGEDDPDGDNLPF